jgi:hypothetical protein
VKRYRNVFLLAGLLVVILGVGFWDDWQTKRDEKNKKLENKWLSFKADDVSSLKFSSKAEITPETNVEPQSFTLEKQNDKWVMIQPVQASADEESVKTFLSTLQDFQYEKDLGTAEESKLEEFGLKEPRRTIELGLKDKSSLTINVGNKAPVGYSVYLTKSADQKIYLGSQSLDLATAKSAKDFRDKTLLTLNREKIKFVTFNKAGSPGVIKFAKEKGDYSIVSPASYKADQAAVIDFIDDIGSQKVADFVDKPDHKWKEAFSPSKRFAQLSIEYEDGNKTELTFAELAGDFAASYNPDLVVFKLDKSFKDKINKTLTDFRDRKLVSFDEEDVTSVELNGTAYVRKKSSWYLKEDEKVEKAHIKNLISDVTFAKAKDFIPSSEFQVVQKSAPLHRLKFAFKDEKKPPVIIDAWEDPKKADLVKVLSSDAKEAMLVEKNVFVHMKEGMPDLKPTEEDEHQGEDHPGLEDLSN